MAKVLSYDEARRVHFVRYVEDNLDQEEQLHVSMWRGPLPRPTARTAKKLRG